MTPDRVRFAPSPTGYLHVGGARTALFNWLHARREGGAFLLRIEDTDKERSTDENVRVILDGLRWLGLDWDEEVVFQSTRLARHRELAHRLVAEGSAYEHDGAIRFRMPRIELAWEDGVYGPISFHGDELVDWVILRSDGSPTYNFSVVVDDIDMGITLVMRGDDHISNTPKQIAVYRALEREPPQFAHLPMIHGPDGKKLSKRHGATAVGDYREMGILPAAMRNFLALLGWNPGGDRELFFDARELIAAFTIARIQKTSAVFDRAKLEWMNGQHLSRTPPEDLLPLVAPLLEARGLDPTAVGRERLLRCIEVVRERSRTTLFLAHQLVVRLDGRNPDLDAKAKQLIARDPAAFGNALTAAAQLLETVDEAAWEPARLEQELRRLSERLGLAAGKVFQPIRVAVTGSTVSEPVNLLLAVVGRSESLRRMRQVMASVGREAGTEGGKTMTR
jgi:glutamyl-tRNA synthetase